MFNIGKTNKEREELICKVLKEVGIHLIADIVIHMNFLVASVSESAIARALILRPRFMVLDEPTSALDRSVQEAQIVDLLRAIQSKYKLAYLFISHDLKVVKALADRVMVMRQGRLVEEGSSSRIFENPRDPYTKDLILAAFKNKTTKDISESDQKRINV